MPSRVLREGILTSERVNKLGSHAELFYRRLMSVVDDWGRFDAHPAILRATCYPLRVDVVREADISRWLAEVQSAGLIALYAVNSKRYLEMIDFRQQRRAAKSKFPDPPMLSKCEADAKQMLSGCKADAHLGPHTYAHPPSCFFSSPEEDPGTKRFIAPTVAQVAAYCAERSNGLDAEQFVDHYTANGWVQGNARKPIRDWKACVRTWEKNDHSANGSGPRKHKSFKLGQTGEIPDDL